MSNVCKHGVLERSCSICERDEIIDDLKCCGNCANRWRNGKGTEEVCNLRGTYFPSYNVCEDWLFDKRDYQDRFFVIV